MDHGKLDSVNYSDREDMREQSPFRSTNMNFYKQKDGENF